MISYLYSMMAPFNRAQYGFSRCARGTWPSDHRYYRIISAENLTFSCLFRVSSLCPSHAPVTFCTDKIAKRKLLSRFF